MAAEDEQMRVKVYLQAPKGSNLDKIKVLYDLVLQPVKKPSDFDYKKELSLRRMEKMSFPTKDEGFKKRLLAGGGKDVTAAALEKEKMKNAEKRDREKDRSKDKKDRRDDKYDKYKEKDRERNRDKEKEKEREREKEKEKSKDKQSSAISSSTDEKKDKVKPKKEFIDMFGTPIKKDDKSKK